MKVWKILLIIFLIFVILIVSGHVMMVQTSNIANVQPVTHQYQVRVLGKPGYQYEKRYN